MPLDDQIRTAKAVQYQRVMNRPVVTTQGELEEGWDRVESAMAPLPKPRPCPPNDRFEAFRRAGILDTAARFTPCDQHTQPTDLARRIGDWERECPPTIDRYSVGDRRPWKPPSPIWAPAVFPKWPSCPPSSSPSPPPKYRLPPPSYRAPRRKPQFTLGRFKNLDLHSTPKSSPPDSAPKSSNDSQFIQKKPERDGLRQHPPVSYLIEQFKRDGIVGNLTQADALRSEREERERTQKEERKRKPREEEERKDSDVPEWLRKLLRKKRQEYPEPWDIFRKDFSFGPKTKKDEGDVYRPPVSPRSSCSSLPDLSPEVRGRSLKRQRHDSSNANVAAKSPRDRLHSTSSPIPIRRPQHNPSVPGPFYKGFGTLDAHESQRVDFALPSPPDVVHSTEHNVRHVTSDYNPDDVVDHSKTYKHGSAQGVERQHALTPPVRRPSYYGAQMRRHLETVFGQQGKLKANAEEAQKALDEKVRMKTCELQRKPRTTRDHPPVLDDAMSRSATAESSTSMRTPPLSPLTKTAPAQSSISTRTVHSERPRRRSYVARCASSDRFLRTVRESAEKRLRRQLEERSRMMEDTPCPCDTDKGRDWIGDEPL
ncbi:hypothetical protein BU25DRAFT_446946 [Macroventuria anomochaeta]|uniref:Uncharacterized protein n=1 Tax=Macroventuria anomochaeta TaxID=301207 RepID=A0ACB6S9E5_9PLEO|nr:uncharacterized protein BU25DRAFT_446946 [Macroventuria anomochaeta]KAF2630147.1 hypothetical protein BU25DRAFT_446946 [Macroventuria anomochaeta]